MNTQYADIVKFDDKVSEFNHYANTQKAYILCYEAFGDNYYFTEGEEWAFYNSPFTIMVTEPSPMFFETKEEAEAFAYNMWEPWEVHEVEIGLYD